MAQPITMYSMLQNASDTQIMRVMLWLLGRWYETSRYCYLNAYNSLKSGERWNSAIEMSLTEETLLSLLAG